MLNVASELLILVTFLVLECIAPNLRKTNNLETILYACLRCGQVRSKVTSTLSWLHNYGTLSMVGMASAGVPTHPSGNNDTKRKKFAKPPVKVACLAWYEMPDNCKDYIT